MKKLLLFPYVYLRLTAMDLSKLFVKCYDILWNWFEAEYFFKIAGGGSVLILSLFFLRALQTQDHLPFVSLVIAVPFAVVLLLIAITILTFKGEK